MISGKRFGIKNILGACARCWLTYTPNQEPLRINMKPNSIVGGFVELGLILMQIQRLFPSKIFPNIVPEVMIHRASFETRTCRSRREGTTHQLPLVLQHLMLSAIRITYL